MDSELIVGLSRNGAVNRDRRARRCASAVDVRLPPSPGIATAVSLWTPVDVTE